MFDDDPAVLGGASATTDVQRDQLLQVSASRRRSSDPATLGLRSALTDDPTDDTTPPASAADHVTAAGSAQDYPGFVERAFFVLDQQTRPRSWCLRLITWPYPLNLTSFFLTCKLSFAEI